MPICTLPITHGGFQNPCGSLCIFGTPGTQAKLPIHADLIANLTLGPICSSHDAQKWLDRKGWILSDQPYDQSKIICILLTTAALSKVSTEASSAIQAAALLIKDNMFETNTTLISDTIATKLSPLLAKALPDLAPTKFFLDAISTQQANYLSDLKDCILSHSSLFQSLSTSADLISFLSNQLRSNSVDLLLLGSTMDAQGEIAQKQLYITLKLEAVSVKITAVSASSTLPPTIWPSLYATAPPLTAALVLSNTFNSSFPTHFVCIQQCLLQSTCTILILYDPSDPTIPQHHFPADLSCLCSKVNKTLENLDDPVFTFKDNSNKCKTIFTGIQHLDNGAFLLNMDSPDSATCFKIYALESSSILISANFGDSAFYKLKEHPVILKFTHCKDDFNPSNSDHLTLIEEQNSLVLRTMSKAH